MIKNGSRFALKLFAFGLIVFSVWLSYEVTFSKQAADLRQNALVTKCLQAHPVNKNSADAEFAAANRCFALPAPPPNGWELARIGLLLLGTIGLFLSLRNSPEQR